MSKQILTEETIDNFLMHPDWGQVEAFIISHFDHETDITDIDISLNSSVIHAEVIARQRIGRDIKSLSASFQRLRDNRHKTKRSYE